MTEFTPADQLHRLAKRAMDSGVAASLEAAEAALRGYSVAIEFAPDEANRAADEAALLTAVVLARRVFLGGVTVAGKLGDASRSRMATGLTFAEAVTRLGARVGAPASSIPTIYIGGGRRPRGGSFAVRAVYAGWRGGIIPADADTPFVERDAVNPLAAMLAAALAVNEAFLHLGDNSIVAGRRAIGLSLWSPDADWLDPASEPALRFLPSRLWLIGLGHLGQAYLWGLGLLPYEAASGLQLLLHDTDIVTPSTESTSILTEASMVGQRKTRVAALWAERIGFETTITERLFNASTRRLADEPAVALCGVDNAEARRVLDSAGFDLVVEAGLGRGHRDFRSILIHTLPGEVSSAKLWADDTSTASLTTAPAYEKLLADRTLDQCGVTLLAGKAVGAPFVGAVAATLVLAEVLRLLHGGRVHKLIDLDLIDPAYRRVLTSPRDFNGLNPGFVEVSKVGLG